MDKTEERTIHVRVVIEYDVSIPSCVSDDRFLFNRNEGTWCADNLLSELKSLKKHKGCLCGAVKFHLVKDEK